MPIALHRQQQKRCRSTSPEVRSVYGRIPDNRAGPELRALQDPVHETGGTGNRAHLCSLGELHSVLVMGVHALLLGQSTFGFRVLRSFYDHFTLSP